MNILHLSVAAAIVAVMAVFTVFVLLSRLRALKHADADKAAPTPALRGNYGC